MLEKVNLLKAVMADDFETDDDMKDVCIEGSYAHQKGKKLDLHDEIHIVKEFQKSQKKIQANIGQLF